MIYSYSYFIIGHFKNDPSKSLLSILSISLGIALFVSTQINAWKAEKSIIDQTVGFTSENFLGRFVYKEISEKPNNPTNFIKTIYSQLPNHILIEPELNLKSFLKIDDQQTLSIPIIGRDLITSKSIKKEIDPKKKTKKYFFSNSLFLKTKSMVYPIVITVCNDEVSIPANEIEPIEQDGLFIILDIERLQNICKTKSYTHINLIDNSNSDENPSYQPSLIHPNWLYESKKEITERAGIALGSLKINLTIISLVSVLISFFMVSNIYSGLFASQKKEFGILLSIGGTRFSNFFLFLAQTTCLAMIGGLFGNFIGVFISKLNLFQTLNTLTDVNQIDTYLNFPPKFILYGFLISVIGSLFSAIFNAVKAYHILPIELLREKNEFTIPSSRKIPTYLFFFFSFTFICVGVFLGFLKFEKQIIPGLVGIGFVIIGFVLLNFLTISQFISILSKLTKRFFTHPNFILGIKEIEADAWKNSLTISTIMLSTSLVFTLTSLTDSYEASLERWVDQENRSDFSLINEKKLSSGEPGVPINLLSELEKSDLFSDVEPFFINSKFIVNGNYFTLHVLKFKENQNQNELLVSTNFCFLEKLCKGDSIEIITKKKGVQTLKIQDEIEHFFSERGTIVMDYQLFTSLYEEEFLNSIRLTTTDGVNKKKMFSFLKNISEKYQLNFLDHKQLKDLYIAGMNQVFKVLDKLKISAIVISVLSLITSIFYFIKEKSRIIAGLRAIGMSSLQMFGLLFYQVFYLLSHGILSGILNSLLLSPIVVFGINRNAFGWELDYTFPVHFVAKLPIIIPIFSIFITLIPFYFLTRMRISKELNYE
ncbi:ABC transporter permease [Leptospira jelokensis]|uniref:ABC transporter permease n=1 Tax=Leptospira jelokensis TaxID=2484931 RepID=A0A4Z1A867_9LEPT|nr:FtsX-like permease family protein [Leptospira jelokensis]TGL75605.1 ABC transporter permease [Leptospira jelokensis]